jgi:Protein of unknown function (DUF2442)/Domain of unknown function (DUF4160)
VPVICRLGGIRIVLRSREDDRHEPHFHAMAAERSASVRIGDEHVYASTLTGGELAEVVQWAARRRAELHRHGISCRTAAHLARSRREGSIVTMDADLIEVTDVKVLGHYRLRLTFSDGRVGDVDVSDIRDKGNLFEDLRDPDYFVQVRVDPEVGTIAWPNGLDLALERLYREAAPSGGRGLSRTP